MHTGARVFNGKSYDFAMFADTKKEAEQKARKFVGRAIFKEHGNIAYYRITKGAYLGRYSDYRRDKVRYSIWVRVEKERKRKKG